MKATRNILPFKGSANGNQIEAILQQFIRNYFSENTRQAYLQDIKIFLNFLQEYHPQLKHPQFIEIKHMTNFRDFLFESGFHQTSINRKLSCMSALFKEMQNAQIIPHNPVSGVKRPRGDNKKRKTGFTDQEISQILSFYDDSDITGLHYKTLLTFLAYTGCRISEVIHLKVSDLEKYKGYDMATIKAKGSKMRSITIGPELASLLYRLIKLRRKEKVDYIFTNPRNQNKKPLSRMGVHKLLKKTLKEMGLDPNRSLHSFRRTMISHLLENGHGLEVVAKEVGHANVNTTKEYKVREDRPSDSPLLKINY